MMRSDLHGRIFARTIPVPWCGCWIWTGYIRPKDGYGDGKDFRTGKAALAHRLSYETFRGPIPKDMTLDHLCRVRSCVNPDHLEVVTKKVNDLRGMSFAAENARKTHCAKGHPLSGDNLKITSGGRRCRACWVIYSAAYRARRKVAD